MIPLKKLVMYAIPIGLMLLSTADNFAQNAVTVGKWRRYVVEISNQEYSGNPFELKIDAVFKHERSAKIISIPGYYAGGNTWKVGFMPIATGLWTYATYSDAPKLNGVKGTIFCVESDLPGMLKADPKNPKKWKFSDGPYVVPIALRMEFFFEPADAKEFAEAADFLKKSVKGHMYETRLTDEKQWYEGRSDYIFKGDWRAHRFDLYVWDRMEKRMEVLTERGLGAHVMFYSDDAGKPGWKGRSQTEALVIRYAIARLASFPIVWFNTGIDIAEFRNQRDIDWFGYQMRSLDPYGHPLSSRHGRPAGKYTMIGQTFDSRDYPQAHINLMSHVFETSNVPVSMDDAWGENRGSHRWKDHTANDIRRAFWKCVMAGGIGGLIRGGGDGLPNSGYFSIKHVKEDLESEQWLRLINPFVQSHLDEVFSKMNPAPSLVRNGYCIADFTRTKLLFYTPGSKDKFDALKESSIVLMLKEINKEYLARWFDPREGLEIDAGIVSGGKNLKLIPPNDDDWVLLLTMTNN